MLDPERDFLRAEERMTQLDRGGERIARAASENMRVHDTEQARPVHLRGALQLARARIAQARDVGHEEDIAGFVEPAAASAAKHLEQLVRLDVPLEVSREVAGPGDQDGAHGKV